MWSKKRTLSLLVAGALLLGLLPGAALAADGSESSPVTTQAELRSAIAGSSGTAEAPQVIYVEGTLELTAGNLEITDKHVCLKGTAAGATIKRAGDVFINLGAVNSGSDAATLTLENITLGEDSAARLNEFISVRGGTLNIGDDTYITGVQSNGRGGALQIFGGTVNMSGGEISGNTSPVFSTSPIGAGVAVTGDAAFYMTGGSIHDNEAKSITPHGGNTVGGFGGGILVEEGGVFELSGGAVYHNKASGPASCGGGVCVAGGGTFKMTGGSIYDNEATVHGGGVFLTTNGNTPDAELPVFIMEAAPSQATSVTATAAESPCTARPTPQESRART